MLASKERRLEPEGGYLAERREGQRMPKGWMA
jgi:hypothetical protein